MIDKKYRSTMAIVAVFFSLLVFVYFFERQKDSKVDLEEKSSIPQETSLISFPEADVNKLHIRTNSDEFTIEKREDHWVMLQDEAFDVNELAVSTLIKSFNESKKTEQFDVENVGDFGFSDTSAYIEVSLVTGDVYKLSFGDQTLGAYNTYARLNESNTIYVMPVTLLEKILILTKDSFSKTSEEPSAVDSENPDSLE